MNTNGVKIMAKDLTQGKISTKLSKNFPNNGNDAILNGLGVGENWPYMIIMIGRCITRDADYSGTLAAALGKSLQ